MKTTELRQFRRILRRFERVTNSQVRNCCAGVTLPQCLVLLELDEAKRLTVGELASRLGLDNSTLSRTIDTLVRKGSVDRDRDKQDRRVVRVVLTAAGQAICKAIHKQNDILYRGIFDKIPPSKRATVVRNFEILVQAFLDSEDESG